MKKTTTPSHNYQIQWVSGAKNKCIEGKEWDGKRYFCFYS